MTEFSTNMVNSVKKNALNSKDAVVKFVDEIEKSAQQKGVQLFNMINKVEPNVKKFFSKEYGNILESEIGNKPVNIYPTLSNLMGGLETPSTTTGTKNVLSTFINQLIPNMKDKSGVTALKTIAQSSPEQLAQGIPLKQAHWIKQALTDYGNELINSGRSSNNELGFIYKNSAKEIADSIDSQIGEGNVYTSLNRKYADYMNKKDAITSTFGKPQYWHS